jgi:hypothetical protein
MTMRPRRETDQVPAAASAASAAESWEYDATEVTPRPGAQAAADAVAQVVQSLEQPTPTRIDTPVPIDQATPTELMARPERSEPIRVISMKQRAESQPRGDATPRPRVPLHVQLRSMAEVAGIHEASDLGRLAPPHDPRRARARRRRDAVVWACVAIALASGIAFAIWLVAGR